jgi:hypothetical protein
LLKLLHEHRPELIADYRKICFDYAAKSAYSEELASRVRRVAGELGMADKMTLCM